MKNGWSFFIFLENSFQIKKTPRYLKKSSGVRINYLTV